MFRFMGPKLNLHLPQGGSQPNTLPATNSEFTAENQWLEDDFPFLLNGATAMLVSGSICTR